MAFDDLQNLYRQVILESAMHPHHYGHLEKFTHKIHLKNPTCGDSLDLEVLLKDGKVKDLAFSGQGCTISKASASLMTDVVINKSCEEIKRTVLAFSDMVTGKEGFNEETLGDALLLEGVKDFPARIKCATLAWKGIYQAIEEGEK
ncbi:Fe-S cluster assembly sulfur transfer protein SufU [Ligilactobacillus equi]|uniref:NifU family protein n=1 Tax=Ligilactobacillus equi DPC 6820 TaxID=1392007 RepID=V7HZ30_9LACO|nr:SUF system NifU family Fe-S cluster assembly protein [Ligilactobacillus equi]ETA74453.1 NifU family protein [Ligilactobacillus equi DPC 6820]